MTIIIAIVGRPNVGKSTLFNRLTRSRTALVDDQPGVTRDRLYASIRWENKELTIIDTGGFDESDEASLPGQIRKQVEKAVEEADRILFMVDGREGVMPGDQEIADILRRSLKKFFVAVNKIDGPEHDHLSLDFYGLGVAKVYSFSAAHGYGLKALMEDMLKEVPPSEPEPETNGAVRVAVLGRPNVGKSSLINRIVGSERLLVSEFPGTTRDSVDILFNWQGRDYLLIDTAGLRRKARVKEKIEKFSMVKSVRSLKRCHVAVVLLDAATGIVEQDVRICGYAFERERGLILVANKWDRVKKDTELKNRLNEEIQRHFRFVPFAPRINTSALTGERVSRVLENVDLVYRQYTTRIGTGALNRVIEEMVLRRPPAHAGARRIKFFYAAQTGIKPPTFVVFVNKPEAVHFSYKRFMMNHLRESLGFDHTPIRLIFRQK
jgi:GTP-binding protein